MNGQQRKKQHHGLRRLALTAILAALSFVLQVLEFSVPFVPSFLKFDFSDLPSLLCSFAVGPVWGVLCEFIKNLLHLPFTNTGGIGELANFLLGVSFVLPAGIVYRYRKTKIGALLGSLVGMTAMTIVSLPVNLWLTYPFYIAAFFGGETATVVKAYSVMFPWCTTLLRCLTAVNMPFTFVKGAIITLITFVIYKPLSPIIHQFDGDPVVKRKRKRERKGNAENGEKEGNGDEKTSGSDIEK